MQRPYFPVPVRFAPSSALDHVQRLNLQIHLFGSFIMHTDADNLSARRQLQLDLLRSLLLLYVHLNVTFSGTIACPGVVIDCSSQQAQCTILCSGLSSCGQVAVMFAPLPPKIHFDMSTADNRYIRLTLTIFARLKTPATSRLVPSRWHALPTPLVSWANVCLTAYSTENRR